MRTSPRLSPPLQIPHNCTSSTGAPGNGEGGVKCSWSSPGESQKGAGGERGTPGSHAARTLRRALRGPSSARRPEALPLRVRRPGLPPSRPAGADSGFQRTFQVLGCGLAGRPRGGFPPGSRFLAAEGCAPAAAPLTPASSRRRPPRKGVLLRGIFQPGGPTSHPPTWRGTKRSEGPLYAAPP